MPQEGNDARLLWHVLANKFIAANWKWQQCCNYSSTNKSDAASL